MKRIMVFCSCLAYLLKLMSSPKFDPDRLEEGQPSVDINQSLLNSADNHQDVHELYEMKQILKRKQEPLKEVYIKNKVWLQNTSAEINPDASSNSQKEDTYQIDQSILVHPYDTDFSIFRISFRPILCCLGGFLSNKPYPRFKIQQVLTRIKDFFDKQPFPHLYQSKDYKSEKFICSHITCINLISRCHLIKLVFKIQENTFIITMTYYKEVQTQGFKRYEQRKIKANIQEFCQYYMALYAQYYFQDLEAYSTFLLKKIVIRCIDQAFKKNEGDKFDNSKGYDVRKVFTLLLGKRHHSVLLSLKDYHQDVSKAIFGVFYGHFSLFKGYKHSILKNDHCGMITRQNYCQWPQKQASQKINFKVSASYPDISFVAHEVLETQQSILASDVRQFKRQLSYIFQTNLQEDGSKDLNQYGIWL